jgi:orotidine-5'-phosphate decarboxylase
MNPLVFDNPPTYDSPIIVALDYDNEKDVMNLIQQLSPDLCKLKIGKELFTSTGPKLVEKLVVSGYQVFLDLKFHDIPNTTYKACKAAANLGVWMTNVHASGGQKMMEVAKQGVDDAGTNTLLIAVTTLTSMSQDDLYQIGIKEDINTHIINLAKLAHKSGLDGVVCSAHEARQIKANVNDNFLTICPGIRLNSNIQDDQTRIMTPSTAINNMADYLVIGRPITQADNPYQQLININSQIAASRTN